MHIEIGVPLKVVFYGNIYYVIFKNNNTTDRHEICSMIRPWISEILREANGHGMDKGNIKSIERLSGIELEWFNSLMESGKYIPLEKFESKNTIYEIY